MDSSSVRSQLPPVVWNKHISCRRNSTGRDFEFSGPNLVEFDAVYAQGKG